MLTHLVRVGMSHRHHHTPPRRQQVNQFLMELRGSSTHMDAVKGCEAMQGTCSASPTMHNYIGITTYTSLFCIQYLPQQQLLTTWFTPLLWWS
jgi:hypothetical protein